MAIIILFGCFFIFFDLRFRKLRVYLDSQSAKLKTELNSSIECITRDTVLEIDKMKSKYVQKEAFHESINNLGQNLKRLDGTIVRMDDKLQQILIMLAAKEQGR
jgi:hypothetical protein